jgi:hypothetical protein
LLQNIVDFGDAGLAFEDVGDLVEFEEGGAGAYVFADFPLELIHAGLQNSQLDVFLLFAREGLVAVGLGDGHEVAEVGLGREVAQSGVHLGEGGPFLQGLAEFFDRFGDIRDIAFEGQSGGQLCFGGLPYQRVTLVVRTALMSLRA